MVHIVMSIVLFLNSVVATAFDKVRHVPVKRDQIVVVKTSLGIATIIEVPDRPNSVVVGDQDAFKVEYLDQAITIKPLVPGAKSNLYVYTDWARYNIELITGPEPAADYVVYLEHERKKDKSPKADAGIIWTPFTNTLRNSDLKLEVRQVGRASKEVLLIEFQISSTSIAKVRPEWLWMTQEGKTVPIHNLFFSNLEVSRARPIKGTIQLVAQDLQKDQPLKLELRRERTSYLTIKKVNLWK